MCHFQTRNVYAPNYSAVGSLSELRAQIAQVVAQRLHLTAEPRKLAREALADVAAVQILSDALELLKLVGRVAQEGGWSWSRSATLTVMLVGIGCYPFTVVELASLCYQSPLMVTPMVIMTGKVSAQFTALLLLEKPVKLSFCQLRAEMKSIAPHAVLGTGTRHRSGSRSRD